TSAAMPVLPTIPPDLQVASVTAPQHVFTGRSFDVTYTVTNQGDGDTPDRTADWEDRIYLSRDQFLSGSDHYLATVYHSGSLKAHGSYDVTTTLRAPPDLTGPWYVFVITDPPRSDQPRGDVFEAAKEDNNATHAPQQLIIEVPPPVDLQVTSIKLPTAAQAG